MQTLTKNSQRLFPNYPAKQQNVKNYKRNNFHLKYIFKLFLIFNVNFIKSLNGHLHLKKNYNHQCILNLVDITSAKTE